jgi:hypothetical protein
VRGVAYSQTVAGELGDKTDHHSRSVETDELINEETVFDETLKIEEMHLEQRGVCVGVAEGLDEGSGESRGGLYESAKTSRLSAVDPVLLQLVGLLTHFKASLSSTTC